MPISVRLPPRVEQRLAEYCAHTKLTKSEAIKRALERLLDEEPTPVAASAGARSFIGSDKSPGSVADDTKRLLRKHFRGK
jgi:predicted DNA-binding protein